MDAGTCPQGNGPAGIKNADSPRGNGDGKSGALPGRVAPSTRRFQPQDWGAGAAGRRKRGLGIAAAGSGIT